MKVPVAVERFQSHISKIVQRMKPEEDAPDIIAGLSADFIHIVGVRYVREDDCSLNDNEYRSETSM